MMLASQWQVLTPRSSALTKPECGRHLPVHGRHLPVHLNGKCLPVHGCVVQKATWREACDDRVATRESAWFTYRTCDIKAAGGPMRALAN
jgi:hypothetical protein